MSRLNAILTPVRRALGWLRLPRALASLTVKNLVIFLVIMLLGLAPLVYWYTQETYENRVRELAARMELIAEQSLKRLDPGLLVVLNPNFFGTPELRELRGTLGRIQDEFRVDNAVLMRRQPGGGFVYLADGNGFFDISEPVGLHDAFPEARRAAVAAWEGRGQPRTELFGSGTYEYLQINKPIRQDGEVVAMLLLNKYAEDVDQAIRAETLRLLGLTALIVLVGSAVFWVLSTRMLAPLKRLREAAGRVGEGELDAVPPAIRGRDEVASLNDSFRTMVGQLRDSRAALQENNEELKRALARVQLMEDVQKNLAAFVPAAVGRVLRTDPAALERGRVERDVTVLFLDMEGFTHLSETLPPDEVSRLVEEHFSQYLDPIYENQGDINETAGDGLMIIFQDKDPVRHALNAVRTAVAIQRITQRILATRPKDKANIHINIGISSGSALVGFTRFQAVAGTRMTYSATGRTTVLAARLEDLATGGRVFTSEETLNRVLDTQGFQSLGCTVVPQGPKHLKNFQQPENVYELTLVDAA